MVTPLFFSDNFTVNELRSFSGQNISDVHLYLWISLMLLLFSCGSLGNTLTIIAIFSTKKLQTHSNVLVMNMAIIDLLLSAVIYPMKVIAIIIHHSLQFDISESFCKYYGFISVALSFSSQMANCAIAINRFMAIVYASKYYTLQKLPVLVLMMLIPWIVPPAVSSLGLINKFGEKSFYLSKLGFCTFNLDLHSESNHYYKFILAMGIPGLFIPTLIIAFSYIAIYIKVWKVRRNLRLSAYSPIAVQNNEPSTVQCALPPTIICMRIKRFEHRVRGARMMFICFTAFCFTYYPAGIVIVIAQLQRSSILLEKPPLLLWFFGLYFTGCCVNPIVYAWMNKDFRKAFKGIVCSCCSRVQTLITSISSSSRRTDLPNDSPITPEGHRCIRYNYR